ncbi:MAG: hypothetical protein FJX76_22230 [Armatimonadetes bacterium]|nr:hypothetical protein [Armatimonadota bacterium]
MSRPAASAPTKEIETTFETLFEAAKEEPRTKSGLPMMAGLLCSQSQAHLVSALTGAQPLVPRPVRAASLPPAIAQPVFNTWQAPVAQKPTVPGLDALRQKIQKMDVPQSTLDIKINGGAQQVVKAPARPKRFGRVTAERVSRQVALFRDGELAWSELKDFSKGAADHLARVSARLGEHPMASSLMELSNAMRTMEGGAERLERTTVDDAEVAYVEADVALARARAGN